MPSFRKGMTKNEWVSECIKTVMDEGKNQDQAVAQCISMWNQHKKKASLSAEIGNDEVLVFLDDATQKNFDGKPRSDLKDSDFLFPETRSYPIVTPADVKDALSNFGRGNHGLSYEEFVRKLYKKCQSKGPEFVAAIPDSTLKKVGLKK